MARSFDASFTSTSSVARVGDAFGQRQYWLDRIEAFGGGITLDSFTVDADGAVSVATSQDLRREALPGPLAKLYPADLTVYRYEKWTPTANGEFVGDVDVKAVGAPLSGAGQALLASDGEGSRLTFAGSVAFKLPIVGGKIEGYLAEQLRQGLADIQRFTTEWIADHFEDRSAT